MFIRDSPFCRAYIWCLNGRRPSIVFNSALFDILSPAEIQVLTIIVPQLFVGIETHALQIINV